MTKAVATDLLLNALILSWVLGSSYYLVAQDPDMFQRLGAWGVAISVFYFLAIRSSSYLPKMMVARLAEIRRFQLMNTEHIASAHQNAALAAYENHKTREELGLKPLKFGSQMTEVLLNKIKEEPLKYEDFNKKFDELDRREIAAIHDADSNKRARELVQNTMAIVATLQWGFGDLAVKSICGNC